jgi:dTDP-4-dehydrorhamnose 3,5-epimerase
MKVEALAIPDVRLITPRRHGDARGYFCETYRRDVLTSSGITDDFVQDNESLSQQIHTVRGLHFQTPPFAQSKLVRVLKGRIFDVAVDLRVRSPTFGRHVAIELSAENGLQLYIPVGFAHGFCTLEAGTHIAYKVSAYYAPKCDSGLIWNDPELAIEWPGGAGQAVLSDKDRQLPRLKDLAPVF